MDEPRARRGVIRQRPRTAFGGAATASIVVLLVAACGTGDPDGSYSRYSRAELVGLNSEAKSKLYLPESLPTGVSQGAVGDDAEPFRLVGVQIENGSQSTDWIASFSSSDLGGEFKVIQTRPESRVQECADWNGGAVVTLTTATKRIIQVCTPPAESMTQEAAEYWESVEWTTDPYKVSWLSP